MKERCKACQPGMPIFNNEQIIENLKNLPEWRYNQEKNRIERTFNFKGFFRTMAFINAVAWVSHQQAHHPEVEFGYNYAKVCYRTHEANGVTNNDFICAQQVDDLIIT